MGIFFAVLEKINFDSFPETTFSIFSFVAFSAASFPTSFATSPVTFSAVFATPFSAAFSVTSFATSPVTFSAVFPTLFSIPFSNTFFPTLSAAAPAPTAANAFITRFPIKSLRESNIPLEPDSDSGSFSFSSF